MPNNHLNAMDSALAQSQMTCDVAEQYPTVVEKAAAIAFSPTMNHPFVDANKRTGHAAMETFFVLNGYEIAATSIEQEQIALAVAAGQLDREFRLALLSFRRAKTGPTTVA